MLHKYRRQENVIEKKTKENKTKTKSKNLLVLSFFFFFFPFTFFFFLLLKRFQLHMFVCFMPINNQITENQNGYYLSFCFILFFLFINLI